jgi:hypothetical protein
MMYVSILVWINTYYAMYFMSHEFPALPSYSRCLSTTPLYMSFLVQRVPIPTRNRTGRWHGNPLGHWVVPTAICPGDALFLRKKIIPDPPKYCGVL